MKRKEGRFVIDADSGEIVGNVKQERFAKRMTEVWRSVNRAELFTTAEEKILARLSDFLQLNTNAIATPSGEYMSIERMADETGVERAHIRKVVKGLMKKNALGRWSSHEQDVYFINPFLYQCGEIKAYLFNLFDQEYHARMKNEQLERFKAGKKQTSLAVEKVM